MRPALIFLTGSFVSVIQATQYPYPILLLRHRTVESYILALRNNPLWEVRWRKGSREKVQSHSSSVEDETNYRE